MKVIKQISLFTFLILASSCAQNSEEIQLKLDRKVGDKQTIVSATETSSGAMLSIKNTMEVSFEVSAYNGSVYTLTSNLLRIKSETKMGDDIENYDSDKEESSMSFSESSMHSEFKTLLDSTFLISIDNKGNVVKSFHSQNGDLVESPIVDMSNIQIIFPDTKVKVGSKWENEKTNPLTTQLTKTTYTIKDINDQEIIISVRATIAGFSSLMGDSKVTGEYILERKTCNLIKGFLEMNSSLC